MANWILPLLILLTGCGTMKKLALRSANPVFEEASDLNLRERNWNYFRDSAPGNLKLTELLYLQDPKNHSLLALLVKGHAGYAYAVPETLYFQDELAGVENSLWRKEAIDHYTRALDYGLTYLEGRGISRKDLLEMEEGKLSKKIKDKIRNKDLTALLYTGQAWGSLINLQKDNVALISQVPRVKLLFDRACEMKPDIDHGVCDIFYAQYEASRPRMLGGNPEKARELFLSAAGKYPHHLLMRMGLVQYVLVPAMEKDAYEKEAAILREEFSKWENLNRETLENTSPYKGAEDFNLYNAIAKKRFEIIEKYKSKIF